MSIIVLTPPPKTGTTSLATAAGVGPDSFGARLASDFLHLLGREGYHFDSFEQLRDFAQAQIDAANPPEVAAPEQPAA